MGCTGMYLDIRFLIIAIIYLAIAIVFISKIEEPRARIMHAVAHCMIAGIYMMFAIQGHG
jgi:hypothetical protein